LNQITNKIRITFTALVTSIILQAMALVAYTSIDQIIHGDLYQYGLQFNIAWARIYWDNSLLLQTLLIISIILIVCSILFVLRFVRNNNASLTPAEYALPFIIMIQNLFALYLFTRVYNIVHVDLYSYGLQSNVEWEIPFIEHTILLFSLIAAATLITLSTSVLIHFGSEEQKIIQRSPKSFKPETIPQAVKLTSFILITAGTAALLISIFYNLATLSFIGLGLLFWGILISYIRTGQYLKNSLLHPSLASVETATLNQIIHELNLKGSLVYLPPKYFNSPETLKAFIPKSDETRVPTCERIQQQESNIFITNPAGMLLTPPGSDLIRLFEKRLNQNLTRVNLQYLQQNLPKLLIEDLEIVQNFEMETEGNTIKVTIENYPNVKTNPQERQQKEPTLSSPLSNAIAFAIAKSTGKPIRIEKQEIKENRNLTIEYRIIAEQE
jgi:hypothetical protein